ncbi:MAG: ATPase [Desulfovibrionaceae bacterium]|nr:ATPase [Desulfovibrionaceae bacterium]MBF0514181.1 ATPase [Desulfovibrionaceae bacterium]
MSQTSQPGAMRDKLAAVLRALRPCLLAVSGGVDSLTLAVLAARLLGGDFAAVHAAGPAVPGEAGDRLRRVAGDEGFSLTVIDAGELGDENYISNPVNRCYYCKNRLFAALRRQAQTIALATGRTVAVVSGTNRDDLADFRPGLTAAAEHGVRHPYVEADMGKQEVRALARELGLDFAGIPASPCLASRVYTGTKVTGEILRAVDFAETFVKRATGLDVVRCRVRENEMLVETSPPGALAASLAAELAAALRGQGHDFQTVSLDPHGYTPGRAFVKTP